MKIRPIKFEQDDLSNLLQVSEADGYVQIRWLMTDWESGRNRFDKQGECFYVALDDQDQVIAVCGLNDNGNGYGRLRRLYVDPKYRKQGIGKKLSQACIDHGLQTFENIVVNAGGEMAVRFYENWGWHRIEGERVTHSLLKIG